MKEAFIRLSRSMSRVRDPARGAAYLRSIVINLARDHNRRGFVSWRHRPPAQPDAPSAAETSRSNTLPCRTLSTPSTPSTGAVTLQLVSFTPGV